MSGTFFSITVVGARRRLDVRLPADVAVGDLTGELVAMLDEPVEGAPPRWGLVALGGAPLDPERSLAAQHVPAGAMLFVRDLGVAEPPAVIDDYAGTVALIVEAASGRWTPAAFQALLAAAAAVWLLAAGALAARALLSGTADSTPGLLAAGAALGGVAAGRALRAPRTGLALGLAALPLWAVSGAGLAAQIRPGPPVAVAGGLLAVAFGALAAAAAADDGLAISLALGMATVPWAVTLAACAWLGQPVPAGTAILVPLAVTALRLAPWVVVRLAGLDGEPPTARLAARARGASRVLASVTAGIAVTLAGACVLLAAAGGPWGRALAVVAAGTALLHARRRRSVVEVAPLWVVALATLATFELGAGLSPANLLEALAATAAGLAALGLAGRHARLPVGLRRQFERLEAVAATATGPLALGLLGLYEAASRIAGRFG
jgi:type VII secretion integral membrane protein EccD